MGAGTWALVSDQGETYEIYQGAPKDLLREGLQVKVNGTIRDDVMTIAMIGPVLEVKSFEVRE
jgi:cytochrome c-type biogenesis protein CcmE